MKRKLIIFFLMVMMLVTVSGIALAQGVEMENFNGGEALKNLANNNAVVGILYSLVFVEATVIVLLWRRLDKMNEKLLKSFEERLEREENLYSQISRLNTEIELIKQSRTKK